MQISDSELLHAVAAFHQAWNILLREDYVDTQNIGRIPSYLMAAILGAAAEAMLSEEELVTIGLANIELLTGPTIATN